MQFMMLVKAAENCGAPPKELMEAIAKEAEGALKDGTMISSGGLLPTDKATRVSLHGGEITVIDGPFAETKEVVGGFAIFQFRSKQEAVESARHFMELHRRYWPGWQGVTEVRPMYEPGEFPPAH
jgi:hypothetical protein